MGNWKGNWEGWNIIKGCIYIPVLLSKYYSLGTFHVSIHYISMLSVYIIIICVSILFLKYLSDHYLIHAAAFARALKNSSQTNLCPKTDENNNHSSQHSSSCYHTKEGKLICFKVMSIKNAPRAFHACTKTKTSMNKRKKQRHAPFLRCGIASDKFSAKCSCKKNSQANHQTTR